MLSLIPLLIAVGLAVDFVRAQHAKTALQAAVDAAALSAATDPNATTASVKPIVEEYLRQNFPGDGLYLLNTNVVVDTASGTVKFSVSASLKTMLMRIFGIPNVNLGATTEAVIGKPGPLDLVLVLDITSSMNEFVGSDRKINVLKEAALDLVEIVLPAADTKVGIVPYLHEVNVGAHNRGKPWVRAPADGNVNANCRWDPPESGCRWENSTCDGVSCRIRVCSVPGVLKCTPVARTWRGCIFGTRPAPHHASVLNTTAVPYLGFLETVEGQCGPPMTELTDTKATVEDAVKALYILTNPVAQTYIPAGLKWGWNMLRDVEPLTGARTKQYMADNDGQRVMILMTDGMNSYSPANPTVHHTIKNENSHYRNRGSDPGNPASYTNDLTADLCKHIKDDGIILYTVAFAVTDPTIMSILELCASDPDKFFDAEDADDLITAFKDIANSFRKVRLVQ